MHLRCVCTHVSWRSKPAYIFNGRTLIALCLPIPHSTLHPHTRHPFSSPFLHPPFSFVSFCQSLILTNLSRTPDRLSSISDVEPGNRSHRQFRLPTPNVNSRWRFIFQRRDSSAVITQLSLSTVYFEFKRFKRHEPEVTAHVSKIRSLLRELPPGMFTL